MNIFSLLTSSNLTSLGLVIVIIWQVIKEIRSNNSSLTTKMLSDYKERNEQLEGILKDERQKSEDFKDSMDQIIAGYKVEIAKLESSNKEKDIHTQTLKDLLLDKNPEVIKVLVEIRDFLKTSDEKTDKVLSYQTSILEDWKKRSYKIDQASKTHKGDIIRTPLEVI